MTEQEAYVFFFNSAGEWLQQMFAIFEQIGHHWYFAIMLACGALWLGFDIIQVLLGNEE